MTLTPIIRVAVALTLIGVIAIVIATSVLRQSVERLRADRALVEHREMIAQQVERLLNDLKETEPQRETLRHVRPSQENLVRFVEGLETAAARTFIEQTIAAIPPQSDTSSQPYNLPVVRYRVTLLGTADKVETYLREIARLPELVRMELVEWKAPPDGHVFENATAEVLLAVAVQEAHGSAQ